MGRELTGRRRGGVDGRRQTVDGRLETRDGRLETAAESLQSTVRSPQSNSLGLRPKEFWAVNNVSFELKRGECLGLIGRNGAGKTTLLKMLNGLIKPDAGRIEMRGRVGALISLGAGFNGVLTGRENIYTNASVLGLSKKEIDAKLDEIIDFAEIGDFIDTPVQNYSSGMTVRLGFAVATALEPDILLLDEVLAVGDAAFRSKCYSRIVGLRKKAAVILVSHNMEQIARVCDRALVLSRGTTLYRGTANGGIEAYDRMNETAGERGEVFLSVGWPILDFSYSTMPSSMPCGGSLLLRMRFTSEEALPDFVLRITFFNASGLFSAECNLSSRQNGIQIEPGQNQWDVQLAPIALKKGRYRVSINLLDSSGDFVVWSHKQQEITVTGGYPGAIADYQLQLHSWNGRQCLGFWKQEDDNRMIGNQAGETV